MYFLRISTNLYDKGVARRTVRALIEPDIRFYRTLLVCLLVKYLGNDIFMSALDVTQD